MGPFYSYLFLFLSGFIAGFHFSKRGIMSQFNCPVHVEVDLWRDTHYAQSSYSLSWLWPRHSASRHLLSRDLGVKIFNVSCRRMWEPAGGWSSEITQITALVINSFELKKKKGGGEEIRERADQCPCIPQSNTEQSQNTNSQKIQDYETSPDFPSAGGWGR